MVSEVNWKKSFNNEITSLIAIGKSVVDRKLVVGSGGNLSMLLPDRKQFLITATGSELDQLDQSSFAIVDLNGNFSEGSPKPSSEYRVHLESYRARSDINTCIHLHPQASIFAAAIDEDIKLITTDHLYYLRKIARIPWIAPGTQEVADATALALADCNIIVLENHGCVVVADNPRLAYSRALNLEEAAEMTIRSVMLNVKPKLVPDEFKEYLRQKGL
jgi:L-fuculose-phosphate aldolase